MSRDGGAEQVVFDESRQQLGAQIRKITHCLRQLDDGQIWWRPAEGMNSIGNLVLHLVGNLDQRFGAVIGGGPDQRDRPREFAERGPIPRDELIRRLDGALARAESVLDGLASGQGLEPREYPALGRTLEGTVLAVLLQTLLHLAGHTQEIIFMTRSQLGDRYLFENPAATPAPSPAS